MRVGTSGTAGETPKARPTLGRRLTRGAGLVAVLLVALSFFRVADARAARPLDAVREHALGLGHAPEELVLRSGGYSGWFWTSSAHGVFDVRGRDLTMTVELARPLPFGAWQLRRHELTGPQ